MTTDRFNYHKIKPGNHGIIKGILLAVSIHGVLFFVGEKLFVKPVQYNVQSDNGSIDVDLVTALPQSDTDAVESLTPATEKQQEAAKIVHQEELTTLPRPDVDAVRSSTSMAEQQQETIKIVSHEEQVTLPQPSVDAAKSITSPIENQQETGKTMPRPSQGTIGTKGKPCYFQNRPPEYPQLARQMHQEGLVMLSVEVDQKGMPVKVEVKQSSGYQLLDQAALKAVKRWRFQPERIGDIPIRSRVEVPVRFRLEE